MSERKERVVLDPRRRRQHGFSLLEVLVALLVLSIGLLGLAALQTMGLKFNTQSYQRTQAVLNAYDIIDRIRANPVGMAGGNYDDIGISAAPPTLPTCPCSPAQMADYDIAQWKASLATLLTSGSGAVCRGTLSNDLTSCTAAATATFQVGIQWKENDLDMRMVVEAQL
ncbi:MAG: type IV pilus modification protein PilV [Xanthomonadales bacterium]|nr:type IV pilus modification protein PilV [Xanthomonadales bacterium]